VGGVEWRTVSKGGHRRNGRIRVYRHHDKSQMQGKQKKTGRKKQAQYLTKEKESANQFFSRRSSRVTGEFDWGGGTREHNCQGAPMLT